ncbi:MAG: RluA family pseudouridine synthase [Pirellulaceae bacterium]|nr:RluA family pseudouridine synthase [Planctomycetales bacterium]
MKNEKIKLEVVPQMPLPARRLQNIVQRMLRVGPHAARKVIEAGDVFVNDRSRSRNDIVLEVGDHVVVVRPLPKPVEAERRSNEQTRIVYEDKHLLVVEKPAGLLTVPTPHDEKHTLLSELRHHVTRVDRKGDAYCVHRLDRGVSGLLVFGKSLDVAERLRDQFAERKPLRSYAAIVAGRTPSESGTFRSYLATDKNLNRYVVKYASEGELAITHYTVRQRWMSATLVEVRLETGRRNQIRVHFAEEECPVVGDRRYRPDLSVHPCWPFRRIALHAQELGFRHPISRKNLSFRSSWPEAFKHFMRRVTSDT